MGSSVGAVTVRPIRLAHPLRRGTNPRERPVGIGAQGSVGVQLEGEGRGEGVGTGLSIVLGGMILSSADKP